MPKKSNHQVQKRNPAVPTIGTVRGYMRETKLFFFKQYSLPSTKEKGSPSATNFREVSGLGILLFLRFWHGSSRNILIPSSALGLLANLFLT